MKKILISIFGFLAALFFSYKKGASNQKQETENEQYKATIGAVKQSQKIQSHSAGFDRNKLVERL